LQNCENTSYELAAQSIQFLGYPEFAEIILQTPEIISIILEERARIINQIYKTIDEKIPLITNLKLQMYYSYANFKSLLLAKPEFCIELIPKFINQLPNLQVTQIMSTNLISIPNTTELLNTTNYISKKMIKLVTYLISTGDLTNQKFAQITGKSMKEAFIIIKQHSVFTNFHHHIIVFHRCLSIFLTNYLLTNYWLDPIITDPKIAKKRIFELILPIFELKDEIELNNFALDLLQELLQSIGLFIRIQVGEWSKDWIFTATNSSTYAQDSALAIILISFLQDNPNLLQILLQKLHPESKDILFLSENLFNNDTKKSCEEIWNEASKIENRSIKNLQQIIENSLYTIANWLSNDTFYYSQLCLVRGNEEIRNLKAPGYEKTKKIFNMYSEHSIGRNIVQQFLIRKESEKLTKDSILSNFPRYSQDTVKILDFLRQNATASINQVQNIQEFMLSEKCLALFDPFLYNNIRIANLSGQNALDNMLQIQSLRNFDYLFGEFSNEFYEKNLNLTPFRGIIRNLMGNIKFRINEISKCTPWLIRSFLKIILAIMPFSKENYDLIINEGLQQLFICENDIIDENASLLEKYKEILGLSEEIPILKKHASEDEKLKLHQIRDKIRGDFGWKLLSASQDMTNSPSHFSNKIDPSQAYKICCYCQIEFDPINFDKNPYGSLIFIQNSSILSHEIAKNAINSTCLIEKCKNNCILSECGHYIHNSCYTEILENPQENSVCLTDLLENKDYILCPVCQLCANSIKPPLGKINENSEIAQKMMLSNIFAKIHKIRNPEKSKNPSLLKMYKILIELIWYEIYCNPKNFLSKQEIYESMIHSIKMCLQNNISTKETKLKIQQNIEKMFKFTQSHKYKLFETDCIELYINLIFGMKIVDFSSTTHEKLYEELKQKTEFIIKMYEMQIVLYKILEKTGLNYENIHDALYNKENFEKISHIDNIKPNLFEFIKKITFINQLFYPTTKHIESHYDLENYIKILGLLDIPKIHLKKEDLFIETPKISALWMKKCWKSYLRLFKQSQENFQPISYPLSYYVVRLIEIKPKLIYLSEDYNEMQRKYENTNCSICGNIQSDTAICLLCGDLICFIYDPTKSESKKQKAELTKHSQNCASGCGIFLRFLNNKIFLIDGGQVCCFPSFYVNQFGESADIRTEKDPLKLEKKIVNELLEIYVNHKLKQTIRTISLRSAIDFKEYSHNI